ncbi:MAG: MBL fold metallo-hydrolase [Gammaproteobacteria bacterium]|nr:MAG: MBL fold metallo-hydrolase [Gammaproteobacteria bacterium]
MSITINTLRLGNMDNFIHIISDKITRQAMIVDPAWDAEAIWSFLAAERLSLVGILLTHSHRDHTSAVAGLMARQTVPVYISRAEWAMGLVRLSQPTLIADNDELSLGNKTIKVIATPGHTAGGLCYLIDQQYLITGDTLFIDGCGRCDFAGSDVNKMFDSLQRLKSLPNHLIIYSGHDYGQRETDTLGNQKLTNPYLLIEDRAFFIEFRLNLQSKYRSIPFSPSSQQEMRSIQQQEGF